MAFRLLLLAERSWRRLDGHELLPLVRAGVANKRPGKKGEEERAGGHEVGLASSNGGAARGAGRRARVDSSPSCPIG